MCCYPRKRSLGQGNIFTSICHSVHGGGMRGGWVCVVGGMCGRAACMARGCAWQWKGGHGMWGMCGGGYAWQEKWLLHWVVHILLECILVSMGCVSHSVPRQTPSPYSKEQAVRILLECFLVYNCRPRLRGRYTCCLQL